MRSHRRAPTVTANHVLVIASIMVFTTGCAHAVPLTGAIEPQPDVPQIPLAVGVYYSPDFRAYKYDGSRKGDRWIFPLGEASVKMLDQLFPRVFQSAAFVAELPSTTAEATGMVAIIEPSIAAFDFQIPIIKAGTYRAEITYRFTAYSPQGVSIVSWTVTGHGARKGKLGFSFSRWPSEAADLAMRDAATKIVASFREVPEVRRWLEAAAGREPGGSR